MYKINTYCHKHLLYIPIYNQYVANSSMSATHIVTQNNYYKILVVSLQEIKLEWFYIDLFDMKFLDILKKSTYMSAY